MHQSIKNGEKGTSLKVLLHPVLSLWLIGSFLSVDTLFKKANECEISPPGVKQTCLWLSVELLAQGHNANCYSDDWLSSLYTKTISLLYS